MNVFNKMMTFGIVNLTSSLTDDTPDNINFMYGFILWISLPLIGLIPALLVLEDLRRLNMKDVRMSEYIEERTLMAQTVKEKTEFLRNHKVIANNEVLDHFFIIEAHRSARDSHVSERMTTED